MDPSETLALRARQRREFPFQIVHDSIHRRPGWAATHLLEWRQEPVGFATTAIGGPWTGKPTAYECYVMPEHAGRVFELFDAFLDVAQPVYLEFQTNLPLASLLLHSYGRDFASESIVFADHTTTHWPSPGGVLRALTAPENLRACLEQRQGGGEWALDLDGESVATGGILFHYNRPFGDVYMEVREPFRRRGFGAYLVQELKRTCYELGAVPAARCNTRNLASCRTLQRAGFAPVGHLVHAGIAG